MLMSHDDDFSIIWKSYNKQLDNDLFFFFFGGGFSQDQNNRVTKNGSLTTFFVVATFFVTVLNIKLDFSKIFLVYFVR